MVKLMLILHLAGVAATLVYAFAALMQIISRRGSARISRFVAVGLGTYETITGIVLIVITPGVSVPVYCLKGLAMMAGISVLQTSVEYRLQTQEAPLRN